MRLHTKTDRAPSGRDPGVEENDIPFVKNELRDQSGTMGKPLDTPDAPGRADSEFVEDEPREPRTASKNPPALY